MNMDEIKTTHHSRRHRRLRRLGHANGDGITKTPCKHSRPVLMSIATLLIAAVALFAHSYDPTDSPVMNLMQDFLNSYRQHFNQIVYGHGNYCEQELDTQALFENLKQEQILHQEEAMQKLQTLLRNNTPYNSLALVGSSGVGKSLVARSLGLHFPWRKNVHAYAWNTDVDDEVQRFRLLRMFVENFSDCGRNLLVVDNLKPCDKDLVSILRNLILAEDELRKKQVVVIYIFNLNSMETEEVYKMQHDSLQNLPYTATINFKSFGIEELKDCIQREALMENLTLSTEAFDEVVTSLDPTYSGCKNARVKVLLYGDHAYDDADNEENMHS